MISHFKSLLPVAFLLLFNSAICHSQTNYYAIWFSSDSNHLPQNSVKYIMPDKYGFIWIATENGVVRYDGLNFKAFNIENTKGITSNRMLLFDGSIEKDSIIILNEKDETLLITKRGLKSIKGIVRPEKDLKKLNRQSYLLYPGYRYTDRSKPFAMTAGNETYVFGQDSVRIYNQSLSLKKQYPYTYKDSTQFFISCGSLYRLGNNNDYIQFPEQNNTFKKFDRPFSKNSRIYNNIPAQQSFIYSDKELFYIKRQNGIITTKSIFKGFDFLANNIMSLYYDEKNEVLFLGSTNKGLLMVKHKDFKQKTTPYYHTAGTDDVYYGVTAYSKNSVLASTGEIFNTNGTTALVPTGAYTDKYMVIADNNNDVWTKIGEEVYRYHKKSNYKTSDKWIFKNSLSTLSKGLDGTIWVGTFNKPGNKGGFLYKIDPKEASPTPHLIMKLDFAPSDITETDRNFIWVGSWKGLYKVYPMKNSIEKIKGVPETHVRNIYSPNANEAWVCTYGSGFYFYKNGRVTTLPLDKNQHLLTPHCIIEDAEGLLWITTNKGLFAIKKQDLTDYANHKREKVYYHLINKSEGFTNNEFNGGCKPCGVFLEDKTIFFPSMDGIVYYNPDMVKKRMPENDIYIDEIAIDGNIHLATDSLVFNRKFGRIKFYISSPFYGNAYNQNIEVKLEGPVTQNWTALTESNVSFSTLPPGEYTLKTRKLSGFGSKWITKDLTFSIPPAFWQTEWFTGLLTVLGIFCVYLIYLLRIRYIKHKNVQLEKQVLVKTEQLQNTIVALRKTRDNLSKQVTNHKKLIKTITHDIKSPLRFLAITGRFVYNNIEKKSDTLKDDVKAIHTSSTQLYHFVDNFLEYAKETDIDTYQSDPYLLYDLVNEKAVFFKNLANAAKTIIVNNVNSSLLTTINRHLLSIILHNLLDNAIKNTYNGIIAINAVIDNKSLAITIRDNGKGMLPEIANHYQSLSKGMDIKKITGKGMGLSMIVDLLAIMEGYMTIISKEDVGTTITVCFNLKN